MLEAGTLLNCNAMMRKSAWQAVGAPRENGYAERVIRTIKEEEVYRADYANISQARHEIGHFIQVVYPHQRLHSALGYLTPAEFEAQWHDTTP